MVRSGSWNFFPTAPFVPVMSAKWEGAVSNSSAAVAQYLPFLRRYARALTGSQASGDAYVAASLEALIADRAVIEDPRGLASGQRPCKAAQEWQVLCYRSRGIRHGTLPFS